MCSTSLAADRGYANYYNAYFLHRWDSVTYFSCRTSTCAFIRFCFRLIWRSEIEMTTILNTVVVERRINNHGLLIQNRKVLNSLPLFQVVSGILFVHSHHSIEGLLKQFKRVAIGVQDNVTSKFSKVVRFIDYFPDDIQYKPNECVYTTRKEKRLWCLHNYQYTSVTTTSASGKMRWWFHVLSLGISNSVPTGFPFSDSESRK